uniref:L1 transposable element RRM domain-containing protein n=1 Tax=Sus scrofa TaxID=9823 RepID=A0A8D1UQV7_PIG
MKKLKSHFQIKEQENSPKAANNETDFCTLTYTEFKREIVKILKELRLNAKELREGMNSNEDYFMKELNNIWRKVEKLENSFAETQTELKALKSKMNNVEEQISDLEDRIMEITQSRQQTENQMKKYKSNIRDLQDNIKWANLRIIGILEGEQKEKGIENIFEGILSENFPNLKETDIKTQDSHRAPNKLNQTGPQQTNVKVKDKERILKAAREKQNANHKGPP